MPACNVNGAGCGRFAEWLEGARLLASDGSRPSDANRGVIQMNVGQRYVDGEYLEQYPDWHEDWSDWKAGHISQVLNDDWSGVRKVCEIGSGSGGVLQMLAARHPEIEFRGFDVSPVAMDIASRKTSAKLSFEHGSPFDRDEAYDLLIANDVFEHVEDYYSFLRQARRISTRQVYHIPLDLTVQALLVGNSMMAARHVSGHLHYFYKDTALATLEDTGHKVVRWHYTCGAIDRPGSSAKRRAAAVVRRMSFGMAQDWTARVLGGFSMMVLCDQRGAYADHCESGIAD